MSPLTATREACNEGAFSTHRNRRGRALPRAARDRGSGERQLRLGGRRSRGPTGLRSATASTASKEAGEPAHAGNAGGRSIWFTWTAPAGRHVYVFDTFPSTFDTLLAVYTGTDVAALAEVASNDDAARPLRTSRSIVASSRIRRTTSTQWRSTASAASDGRTGLRWRDGPSPTTSSDAAQTLTGSVGKAQRWKRLCNHRARRAEPSDLRRLGLVRVDGPGKRSW